MGLLEGILELAFPTRCAGCDAPGVLVCATCRDALPLIDPALACAACGYPMLADGGRRPCPGCGNAASSLDAVRAAGQMRPPLSRLITMYKDSGERRLASELAALTAHSCRDWSGWAHSITHVPSRPSSLASRGFDHAELIARELALISRQAHLRLLAPRSARDQRGLDRESRLANATRSLALIPQAAVPRRVLLVDDVMTTGATLEAAAAVLLDAGAREVRAVVVARTPLDENTR